MNRKILNRRFMERGEEADEIPYRADIPGIETIKIKRRILVKAIRRIACDKWECPEYDKDKYEVEIFGEAIGLCESCRKAIEWAKEQMKGR